MKPQDVHRILGNSLRRMILLEIGKGEKYLTEIAKAVEREPQTVDFHLSKLEDIGVISSEQKHGKVFYRLVDSEVLNFLKEGTILPPHLHPKPPHEIIAEFQAEIREKLDGFENKLDRISGILVRIEEKIAKKWRN